MCYCEHQHSPEEECCGNDREVDVFALLLKEAIVCAVRKAPFRLSTSVSVLSAAHFCHSTFLFLNKEMNTLKVKSLCLEHRHF